MWREPRKGTYDPKNRFSDYAWFYKFLNSSFMGCNQKFFIHVILQDMNYWKTVFERVRNGSSALPLFVFSYQFLHYSPLPLHRALCSTLGSTFMLQYNLVQRKADSFFWRFKIFSIIVYYVPRQSSINSWTA